MKLCLDARNLTCWPDAAASVLMTGLRCKKDKIDSGKRKPLLCGRVPWRQVKQALGRQSNIKRDAGNTYLGDLALEELGIPPLHLPQHHYPLLVQPKANGGLGFVRAVLRRCDKTWHVCLEVLRRDPLSVPTNPVLREASCAICLTIHFQHRIHTISAIVVLQSIWDMISKEVHRQMGHRTAKRLWASGNIPCCASFSPAAGPRFRTVCRYASLCLRCSAAHHRAKHRLHGLLSRSWQLHSLQISTGNSMKREMHCSTSGSYGTSSNRTPSTGVKQ